VRNPLQARHSKGRAVGVCGSWQVTGGLATYWMRSAGLVIRYSASNRVPHAPVSRVGSYAGAPCADLARWGVSFAGAPCAGPCAWGLMRDAGAPCAGVARGVLVRVPHARSRAWGLKHRFDCPLWDTRRYRQDVCCVSSSNQTRRAFATDSGEQKQEPLMPGAKPVSERTVND
jgi:hypothetical protein